MSPGVHQISDVCCPFGIRHSQLEADPFRGRVGSVRILRSRNAMCERREKLLPSVPLSLSLSLAASGRWNIFFFPSDRPRSLIFIGFSHLLYRFRVSLVFFRHTRFPCLCNTSKALIFCALSHGSNHILPPLPLLLLLPHRLEVGWRQNTHKLFRPFEYAGQQCGVGQAVRHPVFFKPERSRPMAASPEQREREIIFLERMCDIYCFGSWIGDGSAFVGYVYGQCLCC